MGQDRAALLAASAEEYRGIGLDEQKYRLAMAVARAEVESETQIPDLGAKEFWRDARESLVKQTLGMRIVVKAVAVTVAMQVIEFAEDAGLSFERYRVALAVLTAMVVDAVLDALEKRAGRGDGDGQDRS